MAWLELEPSGCYHVAFRFADRKFKKSLGTKSKKQADTLRARLEENIRLVELGRLEMPRDADVPTFLLSDGKLNGKPTVARSITLASMFDKYRESLPDRSVEESTLYTARIHMNHVARVMGRTADARGISLADLQRYVDKRSKEKGHGGRSAL
jgi:hypothetical protein